MNRMKNCLAVIFLGLLIQTGCNRVTEVTGTSDTEISATINGQVIDTQGLPVASALVRLRNSGYLAVSGNRNNNVIRDKTTGPDGFYSIDSVKPGEYSIEINSSDSLAAMLSCEVLPGEKNVSMDTVTLKPGAVISGQVYLSTVVSVKSAVAVVEIAGLERNITVDSTGFFSATLPSGGNTLVLSGPDDYVPMELKINLEPKDQKYLGSFWLYSNTSSPCSNYSCDTTVVRQILDSCGRSDISVESVTTVRNGRIVGLNLRGLGKNVCSPQIAKLKGLEMLDLGSNDIETGLEFLGQLWLLNDLKLDSNSLNTVPDNICSLMHLRKLDLSDNRLSSLPMLMNNLTLFELDLSNNELCDLPNHLSYWVSMIDPDWSSTQRCMENPETGN